MISLKKTEGSFPSEVGAFSISMMWSRIHLILARENLKGKKGETYQVEMCFEVGRGMKHSKVRDQEGGEGDELSQAGRDLLISFRMESDTAIIFCQYCRS